MYFYPLRHAAEYTFDVDWPVNPRFPRPPSLPFSETPLGMKLKACARRRDARVLRQRIALISELRMNQAVRRYRQRKNLPVSDRESDSSLPQDSSEIDVWCDTEELSSPSEDAMI